MAINHTQDAAARCALESTVVADAMHPGVVWTAADSLLRSIAQAMTEAGIHSVLVMPDAPDTDSAPLIVSDVDLVRGAVDGDPESITAREIASEPVLIVSPGEDLASVAMLMAERDTAHALVVDIATTLPRGVISSADLVAVIAGGDPRAGGGQRPSGNASTRHGSSLDSLHVRNAMSPDMIDVAADATLVQVAAALTSQGVHCLAVSDLPHAPHWGLIHDTDVARAAAAGDLQATAAQLAVTEPLTVDEDATLERAAELMVEHDVSHIVATGLAGLPVGVVSTLDVAAVLAADELA